MVTVIDFLVELGASVLEMFRIIAVDVAAGGPIALVSSLLGALVIAFSVGFVGYLVFGALVRELGVPFPSPGRGPREAPPRR
ncbi:hypothetical protein [Halorarum salinum]|uniref:Uncharacterized protein n=1 Tax=Halorarum salinum TaxID=2743089 RepID=A0A7D5Q8W5_9EURY|nr:hypothetical protein [Halobaculum salinum]QLG61237.1 hypothetical protein HUG12_05605 [Halobaculum salinum]